MDLPLHKLLSVSLFTDHWTANLPLITKLFQVHVTTAYMVSGTLQVYNKGSLSCQTAYLGLPDISSSTTKPILGKKSDHITVSYPKGTDTNDRNTGATVRHPTDVNSAALGSIGTQGNFTLAKTHWGSRT